MDDVTIAPKGRRCSKCGQWKTTIDYWKSPRKPDCLSTVCKSCVTSAQKYRQAENIKKHESIGLSPSEKRSCTRCKQEKTEENYRLLRQSASGIDTICAECRREQDRDRYKRDREKRKYQSRWGSFKFKFGLKRSDWELLLLGQNGKCPICREAFQDSADICVDHDHVSKKVRGLLCRKCNMGIGLFGENTSSLRRAADYLEASG